MKQDHNLVLQWLAVESLPVDYVTFVKPLRQSELVNSKVLIYSLQEIIERNETFEVKEYCPGYLAIGDDSGGTSVVLSLKTGMIGMVDHGSMRPEDMHAVAKSFAEWQTAGFKIDDKREVAGAGM